MSSSPLSPLVCRWHALRAGVEKNKRKKCCSGALLRRPCFLSFRLRNIEGCCYLRVSKVLCSSFTELISFFFGFFVKGFYFIFCLCCARRLVFSRFWFYYISPSLVELFKGSKNRRSEGDVFLLSVRKRVLLVFLIELWYYIDLLVGVRCFRLCS